MSRNNIPSFWQSPLWADILTQTQQAEVIEHTVGEMTCLIERRSIWRNFTGLYMLGVDSRQISSEMIETICKQYSTPSDLFLQIEPITGEWAGSRKAPFRRFLEPTTAVLTLIDTTEGELLNHFEEKGRYNIRVAERRGLTSHWVCGDEISNYSLPGAKKGAKTNVELFFTLLQETTERDKFSHNSLSYYQHFISILEKNNAGGLLFVTKEDTLHAAGIFVYTENQGIYYYGASSNAQEIRRDHGTYLLQWTAIKEAIKRECSTYDFLGISSHEGDKLTGVTTFKMRFHPEKVVLPKEMVIILRPFMVGGLKVIKKLRAFFLKKH